MQISYLEGERFNFLVVDPAEGIHKLLKLLLAPIASRMQFAGNEDEGLILARNARPDVIITACGSHQVGIRFCRRLRRDPGFGMTPVIVMTTSSNPRDYPVYLEVGCDQILPAPFRCQQFYAAISSALAGRLKIDLARVQVLFKSGLADFVERHELDQLIARNEILCFRRKSGLAVIGRDPLRRTGESTYPGQNRRHAGP